MKQADWYNILEYTVERTRNIVLVLNERNVVEWVNKSFRQNLQYAFDEIKGQSIDTLLLEGQPFTSGHKHEGETKWKDKEGNVIWVHFKQFLPQDTEDRYTVVIANLITKWKSLEELSREQEILIDGFSNSFSEINIVIGRHFQIMAYNKYADRFFRKQLNTTLSKGKNLMTVMPAWMKEDMNKYILRSFENERLRKKVYVHHFRKFFNLGFFPVSKGNKDVLAVSFHAEDVTRQERYLQELKRQKDQIQKLAWENSHAIRRPVANIIGLTDWLHTRQQFAGEHGFMIRKILESSVDLDRKIKKLSRQLETFK